MNVSYVKLGVMEGTVVTTATTATTATTKLIPLSSLLYEKTVQLIMVVKMLGRSFLILPRLTFQPNAMMMASSLIILI
jgi:hypothetical protein